jgi:hypothetical protein
MIKLSLLNGTGNMISLEGTIVAFYGIMAWYQDTAIMLSCQRYHITVLLKLLFENLVIDTYR